MDDYKQLDESFLYHTPCPHCGSSDAYSVYANGSGYCFACEKYDKVAFTNEDSEGEVKEQVTEISKGDFLEGVYKALPKRQIKKDTCEKYGYSVGSKADGTNVHIAPYFIKGTLTSQHLRTQDKKFSWIGSGKGKTKELELFGQKLWEAGGKRLVITEGEIDCLTISQVFNLKWPVVSIPSGSGSALKALKHNLEFVSSFTEVVLAFDDDEPGHKATEECVTLFSPGKAKVMSYDGFKDANELLVNKGSDAVANCVFRAKTYRPDGIISGTDLWEEVKKEPEQGLDIPYPKLNTMLRGLREKKLYLFTAGSGIGKSTFVRELAYHLNMVHKWPLGIMALEESVKDSAEGLMSIYLNKPISIDRSGIFEETLKDAFDSTVGNGTVWLYNHFGSTQIDNLLSKLRFMVVGCGVKCILLDHISIVVSGLDDVGDDERKTIDRLMTKLRTLIEETGVTILAIVHLKRPPGQGKSFNEGRRPSLTDLRGSGALEQLSDVVVALGRDQQGDDPNLSTVYVLKNRPTGTTGEADELLYVSETGRLILAPDDYKGASSKFEQEEQDF